MWGVCHSGKSIVQVMLRYCRSYKIWKQWSPSVNLHTSGPMKWNDLCYNQWGDRYIFDIVILIYQDLHFPAWCFSVIGAWGIEGKSGKPQSFPVGCQEWPGSARRGGENTTGITEERMREGAKERMTWGSERSEGWLEGKNKQKKRFWK